MNDTIKDYHMSALLMAICLNGMNEDETINLTNEIIESGQKIDLSPLKKITVDKHSTGGVGDKTTLIIAPLVASCGVIVPKMSGRGLGHTGGTIDKLESIEGFKVKLTEKEFFSELKQIGVSVISQTEGLTPADKKIYALRDVTATVESIPLIASSIMSKKIALGADKILIDLKVGTGALIKNLEDAKELARLMIKIGKNNNREVRCILTNMNVPLGSKIGNSLEVEEALEILNNQGDENLKNICIAIASNMVSMGLNISLAEAKEKVIYNLENKLGLKKFYELVEYQGGNIKNLSKSKYHHEVKININGYINEIDAYKLGVYVGNLGAGRKNKDDIIDYTAGIELKKGINEYVNTNDVIAVIHSNKKITDDALIKDAFKITSKKIDYQLIYDILK